MHFLPAVFDEHKKYEQLRQDLIRLSRVMQVASKKAVLALLRSDNELAGKLLDESKSAWIEIVKLTEGQKFRWQEGVVQAALEEYFEASLFRQWLQKEDLVLPFADEDLNLVFVPALGAVSDFTGEVVRHVMVKMHQMDLKELEEVYAFLFDIVRDLEGVDLTKYLRNKLDAAKRNVARMEKMIYDKRLYAEMKKPEA